ncbi:MAG: glutamine synthetase family protein [Marinosulfonomonas sp.]|nr:glutamine synthetase family protein [Marinosulfonomonas sp.]
MTKNPATIRVAAADLNGVMRGKRVPFSYTEKLDKGAVRLPFSALNVDIWGMDIADSPLVFESGDTDGILRPTGRGPVPMPWLATPSELHPMVLHHDDGTPFAGDPRHALAAVLDRYAARGWQVMAATELEFYLVDDSGEDIGPACSPLTGKRMHTADVLSLDTLDAFDAFFTDLYKASADMDLPAQAAISESGAGQFEINLNHGNALKAADDAWLFKTLVRGMARKHGMAATFMAKPFANDAGNGMHVHFSVMDADGNNIFNDGGPDGTATLLHAIAGCLEAMPASALIFAPHANSYARMVPGAHAPTGISWAHENRTAAIRIPGGPTAARRIEHRVAGGDTNPYLMLAVVLGAALVGIEDGHVPPAPIAGNAYEQDLPQLPTDWATAIDLFGTSDMMRRILPDALIRNMVLTKHQELHKMENLTAKEQTALYLESV